MPILTIAPEQEPVSLADAKTWLRIDDSADDARLAALIATARASHHSQRSRGGFWFSG